MGFGGVWEMTIIWVSRGPWQGSPFGGVEGCSGGCCDLACGCWTGWGFVPRRQGLICNRGTWDSEALHALGRALLGALARALSASRSNPGMVFYAEEVLRMVSL